MCSIKVSKNTLRRKIYKRYQISSLKLMNKVNYYRKMTIYSSDEYTFFYKENSPYKSRFSNRKLLHKKNIKKFISVQKVLLHLSLLEFSWFSQYLMKSANPNMDMKYINKMETYCLVKHSLLFHFKVNYLTIIYPPIY